MEEATNRLIQSLEQENLTEHAIISAISVLEKRCREAEPSRRPYIALMYVAMCCEAGRREIPVLRMRPDILAMAQMAVRNG